ncbi:hypothetical protein OF83DRAFT_453391 [Amylostereum chailletii]|nr:hypothetical protein OF83DRAFT_453391 [Amylostereum chailletii]
MSMHTVSLSTPRASAQVYRRTAPHVTLTDLSRHPLRTAYRDEAGPSTSNQTRAFVPLAPQKYEAPHPASFHVPADIPSAKPKGKDLYIASHVNARRDATRRWSRPVLMLADQHTTPGAGAARIQVYWAEPNVFYVVSEAGNDAICSFDNDCKSSNPHYWPTALMPAGGSPPSQFRMPANLFLYTRGTMVDYLGNYAVVLEYNERMSDCHFKKFIAWVKSSPSLGNGDLFPEFYPKPGQKPTCPLLTKVTVAHVDYDPPFMTGLVPNFVPV